MKNMFNKLILAVLTATLVFAVLPVTSAYAHDENPPEGKVLTNEKLEKTWARELKTYERLGKAFDNADARISKIQSRLDKAAENGRDVTALQAALDAFETALKTARPKYESMNGLVNSHQGFDANGKVVDAEKAKSTVQEMGAKPKEVKEAMGGTFKALREAMKAFREANKPAEAPRERDS